MGCDTEECKHEVIRDGAQETSRLQTTQEWLIKETEAQSWTKMVFRGKREQRMSINKHKMHCIQEICMYHGFEDQ